MAEILALQCSNCAIQYTPGDVTYTCPVCGEVGTLDVLYDYAALKAQVDRDALAHGEPSMWRYRALLPLDAESPVPPLTVGMTPLYDAPGRRSGAGGGVGEG
jgi:threonine synthase